MRWSSLLLWMGLMVSSPAWALPPSVADFAYGSHPRQRLDLWRPPAPGLRPLVVHIHGGGWTRGDKESGAGAKPDVFLGAGYAFAALNTRMVPDVTVADMAADIARAVAVLRTQPGVDPDRIILSGHSAGAHLAALVAADARYLAQAGVPARVLKAVLLLDGAGYDLTLQEGRGPLARRIYRTAFGTDPSTWPAVSPVAQAERAVTLPAFWMAVAGRAEAQRQAQALAMAVRAKGARATISSFPADSHMSINRDFGTPGHPAAPQALAFLKALGLP